MRSRFRPVSAGLALLIRPVLAAQPSLPQDGRNDTPPTLDAITVSATPLGLSGDTLAIPVETLAGASLVLKREATLGDTLKGMLGGPSDTFVTGASRTAIRGQTDPAVRSSSDGPTRIEAARKSYEE